MLHGPTSDLQKQIAEIQKALKDRFLTEPERESSPIPETPDTMVKSILWVDDKPRNNAFLIESLMESGFEVVTALSTADGLSKFRAGRFGRVISDMGRTESGQFNPIAGLELTSKIRELDSNVPIVIYTSRNSAVRYRNQALNAGANEITASPTTLLSVLELEIN